MPTFRMSAKPLTKRWSSARAITSANAASPRVLIGLSGGIDSSLTAAIAVDAVGRENVRGVGMPGPYLLRSQRHRRARHGVKTRHPLRYRFHHRRLRRDVPHARTRSSRGARPDVTEENIQSRLRGVTLMALSNKFGALVLTTGNKSELAVGYCTLYGDMCGGLAVISDVPKTLVYELSRVANRRHNGAIPESVFVKPPSAELRPDQKDTDSLPPYDVLDAHPAALRGRFPQRRSRSPPSSRSLSSWSGTLSSKWIATNTNGSRPLPA